MKNKTLQVTPGHNFKQLNSKGEFQCIICEHTTTNWLEVLENVAAYSDGQRLCKKK